MEDKQYNQLATDSYLKLAAIHAMEFYPEIFKWAAEIVTIWGETEIMPPVSYEEVIDRAMKSGDCMRDDSWQKKVLANDCLNNDDRQKIMQATGEIINLQLALYQALNEQLNGNVCVECPHCKSLVPPGNFCEYCGKDLTEQEGCKNYEG